MQGVLKSANSVLSTNFGYKIFFATAKKEV